MRNKRPIASAISKLALSGKLTRSRSVLLSAAGIIAAMQLQPALAASGTWTWANGSGSTDFNTAADWSDTQGGIPTGSTAEALFSASPVAAQPNLSANANIGSLDFSSSGWDLTSSSTSIQLTLQATGTGGAINGTNTSGTNTVDAPVFLSNAAGTNTFYFNQAAGGVLTLNGAISSTTAFAESVEYTTSGQFNVNGANTYSGGTVLNTGATLDIGNSQALGSNALMLNGGTLAPTTDLSGANKVTASSEVLNSPSTIQGSFNLEFGGVFNLVTTTRILTNNISGGTLTLSGGVQLSNTNGAAGTLPLAGSGNTVINSSITDGSSGFKLATSVAGGVVTFSGANTYSGGTTLSGGNLNINSSTALGSASSTFAIDGGTIDNTSNAPINLANNNPISIAGSFSFSSTTGTTNNSLNLGTGAISINASRAITLNGAASLTFGGALTIPATGYTLTVSNGTGSAPTTAMNLGGIVLPTGTFAIAGTSNVGVTGLISDGSAAGTLQISGTGVYTLSGANTYSGGSTLKGGTILLENSSGSALGSGPVTLSAGTATLAGAGSASPLLTVSSGGIIAPGTNGSTPTGASSGNFGTASTLTLGSTGGLTLTLANLDFDLATTAAGTSDEISTAALSLTSVSATFNGLGASLQTGKPYVLIHYGSTAATNATVVSDFKTTTFVGTLAGAYTATYSLDTSLDNVDVTFTATPEPASLSLLSISGLILMRRRKRSSVSTKNAV